MNVTYSNSLMLYNPILIANTCIKFLELFKPYIFIYIYDFFIFIFPEYTIVFSAIWKKRIAKMTIENSDFYIGPSANFPLNTEILYREIYIFLDILTSAFFHHSRIFIYFDDFWHFLEL